MEAAAGTLPEHRQPVAIAVEFQECHQPKFQQTTFFFFFLKSHVLLTDKRANFVGWRRLVKQFYFVAMTQKLFFHGLSESVVRMGSHHWLQRPAALRPDHPCSWPMPVHPA